MYNFLILGGDQRQVWLNRILKEKGFLTTAFFDDVSQSSLKQAAANSQVLLGPLPFTKDGKWLFSAKGNGPSLETVLSLLTPEHILFGGILPDFVKEAASQSHTACFDYMKLEEITIANTVATAEGAIAEALKAGPGCLHKSRCLVTGFGRCGRTLALKLKGLEAETTVADRSDRALVLARTMGFEAVELNSLSQTIDSYDYIFNTIPALVINAELISRLNPQTVTILDIASAPGGVDLELCRERGVRAALYPGLPGIYAPKTSAEILYQAIMKHLPERSFQ